jgi:hypothetical protein
MGNGDIPGVGIPPGMPTAAAKFAKERGNGVLAISLADGGEDSLDRGFPAIFAMVRARIKFRHLSLEENKERTRNKRRENDES